MAPDAEGGAALVEEGGQPSISPRVSVAVSDVCALRGCLWSADLKALIRL